MVTKSAQQYKNCTYLVQSLAQSAQASQQDVPTLFTSASYGSDFGRLGYLRRTGGEWIALNPVLTIYFTWLGRQRSAPQLKHIPSNSGFPLCFSDFRAVVFHAYNPSAVTLSSHCSRATWQRPTLLPTSQHPSLPSVNKALQKRPFASRLSLRREGAIERESKTSKKTVPLSLLPSVLPHWILQRELFFSDWLNLLDLWIKRIDIEEETLASIISMCSTWVIDWLLYDIFEQFNIEQSELKQNKQRIVYKPSDVALLSQSLR